MLGPSPPQIPHSSNPKLEPQLLSQPEGASSPQPQPKSYDIFSLFGAQSCSSITPSPSLSFVQAFPSPLLSESNWLGLYVLGQLSRFPHTLSLSISLFSSKGHKSSSSQI